MKSSIDVIYLDLSKAFDRVSHHILLEMLAGLHLEQGTTLWLLAYLSDRKFCVRVGSTISSIRSVKSGVPQGSILGPLLFLIYINALPDQIRSSCIMYADDLKIWHKLTSDSDGSELQEDLDRVTTWLNEHSLTTNPDKCVCMHINQKGDYHSFSIEGVPIRTSTCERDLGSLISADLSITPNTTRLANIAWNRMGVLARLTGKIDRVCFPFIFRSLIRPLLEINIQALSPYLKRDINALENVQRRASKRVKGLWNTPYAERLKLLNLFPLDYRRFRGDLILMFKVMRTNAHPLNSLFELSPNAHTRGHAFKVQPPHCSSNVRKYAFAVRVCNPWNSLPSEIVSLDSVDAFKRGIDKLLLEGQLHFRSIVDDLC
jgi:Reverse transcriptase (RNA-dependent DNA polymerase).